MKNCAIYVGGALCIISQLLATEARLGTSDSQSTTTALESRHLTVVPCVHDECPAIYVQGAGMDAVNGLYEPFLECSDENYGKTTKKARWKGYMNRNGAEFLWYINDASYDGWGIWYNSHHRYYDGTNRMSPYSVVTNKFVTRSGYGKSPTPEIDCLQSATVYWEKETTVPGTKWSLTQSEEYSETDVTIYKASVEIGAIFKGITGSASFSAEIQSYIQKVQSTTQTVECENPCPYERDMWVEKVSTGSKVMLAQCELHACVPIGSSPQCPSEYCGGARDDGCQCCTSHEWIADDYKGERPPICTPKPTPSPTKYPTPNPTNFPTPTPTNFPTPNPTKFPTPAPTPFPTSRPTTKKEGKK